MLNNTSAEKALTVRIRNLVSVPVGLMIIELVQEVQIRKTHPVFCSFEQKEKLPLKVPELNLLILKHLDF